MKIFALLLLIPAFLFAADEKGDYIRERYFPVSWEPPTITIKESIMQMPMVCRADVMGKGVFVMS